MISYHVTNGQNNRRRYVLEEVRQVAVQCRLDVRQLQYLVEFVRSRHRGQNLLFTVALLMLMFRMFEPKNTLKDEFLTQMF